MDQQTEKNLLDMVKRNYEEIAADFDLTRKKPLWPELVKLTEMVKDGDRVLDAGCGNGRLAEAFGQKNVNYLGVDGSKNLVEAAKKNFLDSRLRGNDKEMGGDDEKTVVARNDSYKFILGDILELDRISEKDFDYVYSIAVLHHLPGENLRVQALKQMKNKIKPGGKIIITVWNLWNQKKFRKLILKFAILKILGKNKMDFGDILFSWKNNQGQEISRRYYHAFTKSELKKIAVKAGLKITKIYKDRHNYYLILENGRGE